MVQYHTGTNTHTKYTIKRTRESFSFLSTTMYQTYLGQVQLQTVLNHTAGSFLSLAVVEYVPHISGALQAAVVNTTTTMEQGEAKSKYASTFDRSKNKKKVRGTDYRQTHTQHTKRNIGLKIEFWPGPGSVLSYHQLHQRNFSQNPLHSYELDEMSRHEKCSNLKWTCDKHHVI